MGADQKRHAYDDFLKLIETGPIEIGGVDDPRQPRGDMEVNGPRRGVVRIRYVGFGFRDSYYRSRTPSPFIAEVLTCGHEVIKTLGELNWRRPNRTQCCHECLKTMELPDNNADVGQRQPGAIYLHDWVMRDGRLSIEAKVLHGFLMCDMPFTDQELADSCRMSVDQLQKPLAELRAAGLLNEARQAILPTAEPTKRLILIDKEKKSKKGSGAKPL